MDQGDRNPREQNQHGGQNKPHKPDRDQEISGGRGEAAALMSPAPDEIVKEIHISASPAEVFPYLIDADKMRTWKAVKAEVVGAMPGATFRMDVTGRGDVATGSYIEVDPPRRVVFTWTWERDDRSGREPGVVEVTLTPDEGGTRLRLVHRGLADQVRERSAAGWAHYLDRLAAVASGEDPGPDPWATLNEEAM